MLYPLFVDEARKEPELPESEIAAADLPESPARRVATIARVGAEYGFGFVFRRRFTPGRRTDFGRVGVRLRRSFEDLGPNYVELGRYLSTRRDAIPPGVADELGRSSARMRAVPFEEARALLESDLGNDLHRMFLDFDESPHRVGPLTQSHRATLPGGRPALVVFRRPGIRRDLLAMRPVADLARRRLGERLPVNPSQIVSDFAAQTTHRRDMHFAAQTARKLEGVEGFGLRVPKVYRSHSAGRCITFEAAGGEPSHEQLRVVSDELIKLALLEGVFFADIRPERYAVDGRTGEIWIADPTESFSIEPERMRGLAEVFAAARREDVDGVVQMLSLAGGGTPGPGSTPTNAAALKRELREAMGTLGGPLWKEHPLSEIRARTLEAFRRGGASIQPELARMLESLVEAEKLRDDKDGGRGDKPSTIAAAEGVESLVARYRDPLYVAARTARKLGNPDAYADYPRQIHALLGELKDGEVEVRFRHGGLDELISKVDILANRLVFAFLIAALIIGSSMLGIFVEGGIQILGVSIFGFVGFVAAAVMGIMLLVGIIRSGRL
ncbi:MAG: AarF/UbiB family protein [Rubrobacteraceae bacterium]